MGRPDAEREAGAHCLHGERLLRDGGGVAREGGYDRDAELDARRRAAAEPRRQDRVDPKMLENRQMAKPSRSARWACAIILSTIRPRPVP